MAQVEMLKVPAPSPPVPTMSTRCVRVTTLDAEPGELAHHLRRGGDLANGFFLTRRPVTMAAVMTGASSPLMIMRIRCSISSWKISRCSMVRCSAPCRG